MSLDERALGELIEHSEDLQSDAMRTTREVLPDMVEAGRERRAAGGFDPEENRQFAEDRDRLVRAGLKTAGFLTAGGLGAALMAYLAQPAFAASDADIQILQTAASIENLAVATYGVALTLPFIGGSSANGVVKAFVTKTMEQHTDHGKAFNAAVKQLGGKEQTQPDPVLLTVVNNAKPTLTSAGPVVDLAIALETGAQQTYVANVSALQDASARKVTASIMGVEAQHVAILNAVKALLGAGHPELIALPPNAAALPAAAGSIGFPDTFSKTDMARPKEEGAVK